MREQQFLISLLGSEIKRGNKTFILDGVKLSKDEWYLLENKSDYLPLIFTGKEMLLMVYSSFVSKMDNNELSIGEITEAFNRQSLKQL